MINFKSLQQDISGIFRLNSYKNLFDPVRDSKSKVIQDEFLKKKKTVTIFLMRFFQQIKKQMKKK